MVGDDQQVIDSMLLHDAGERAMPPRVLRVGEARVLLLEDGL